MNVGEFQTSKMRPGEVFSTKPGILTVSGFAVPVVPSTVTAMQLW